MTIARYPNDITRNGYNDPFNINTNYVYSHLVRTGSVFCACPDIKQLDHTTQKVEHHSKAREFCDSFAVAQIPYPSLSWCDIVAKGRVPKGELSLGFLCVDSKTHSFKNDENALVSKILILFTSFFSEPLLYKQKLLAQRGATLEEAGSTEQKTKKVEGPV